MKRLVMFLLFMLAIIGYSSADVENYYTTSNTVSFSTTTIVTFNAVVNKLFLRNESTTDSVYVFYKNSDIGWNYEKTYYTTPEISYTAAGVVLPSGNCVRLAPSTTNRWSEITLDTNIDKFAVVQPRSPGANIGVTYVAETDKAQP